MTEPTEEQMKGPMEDPIDAIKPELKEGEILCDGCWAVGKPGHMEGWFFINFKYLKPTWVCPECRPLVTDRLITLQREGL